MILCLIPVWSFQVKVKEETGSLCTSRWEKDQESSSKTSEVSTSMKYKQNWNVNIKFHYFSYVEYRYPCVLVSKNTALYPQKLTDTHICMMC